MASRLDREAMGLSPDAMHHRDLAVGLLQRVILEAGQVDRADWGEFCKYAVDEIILAILQHLKDTAQPSATA